MNDEGEWPARDAVPFVAVKEIVVTPEMRDQGMVELAALTGVHGDGLPSMRDTVTAIYRAMAALAPVPLVSDGELVAVKERDDLRVERDKWRARADANHAFRLFKDSEIASLRAELQAARDTIARMTTEKAGDHPYNGPTAPDAEGKRHSIPDVVHERFHQSVGDVLSGKVLPAAREQMRDALDQAPKDKTPFPGKSSGMAIGLRLP